MAEMLASFDIAIARGDFSKPGDTIERLTGQPPRSVSSFLEQHLTR
ncbi:MAG: hypothetical protein H6718_20700 [Polyangiaceae bacterium]|nr:hypothetical protein [Myxococcales bacterium]MCB9587836.1 hypothetical protein [Polyangiaceae bacterium]MCB9608785.1 hypothetical protein [Polyangiaceae bacterium]